MNKKHPYHATSGFIFVVFIILILIAIIPKAWADHTDKQTVTKVPYKKCIEQSKNESATHTIDRTDSDGMILFFYKNHDYVYSIICAKSPKGDIMKFIREPRNDWDKHIEDDMRNIK